MWWLIVGLAACAGCGDTTTTATTGAKSPSANSCSDSAFADAVSLRLAALDTAVLVVDAGHGNVDALAAGAPALSSAAMLLREAAKDNRPCRPGLLKARRLVLVSARDLSSAGHELGLLTDAIRKGTAYSDLQSQFLGSYFDGSQEFRDALASLRKAGGPVLVSASDGKSVFKDAGCANCHTLAAAGASGTVGPDLDAAPSRGLVIDAVTYGQGAMLSFEGKLSVAQIRAVADFVSQNAGK